VPNSSLWEESQLAGVSANGDEFRHLSNSQITTLAFSATTIFATVGL